MRRLGLSGFLAAGLLLSSAGWAAEDCTADKRLELVAPPKPRHRSVVLNCNVTLDRSDYRIAKAVIIRGSEASGMTLDCNGSTIQAGTPLPALDIQTVKRDGKWSVPKDVTVRNCKIIGFPGVHVVTVRGRSAHNSSLSTGHTERMQSAAPTRITLIRLTITADGGIPLYIHSGVTYLSLLDSEIKGRGDSVSVYLDAETGHNTLKGNSIHMDSSRREQLAIDGSAWNRIISNRFSALDTGGIYVYRNCGEAHGGRTAGTIRHQMPQGNRIINNIFYYKHYDGANPSIWLGSRQGNKSYCGADAGFPFGSSASDLDHAQNNFVAQNQIYKLPVSKMIRVNDSPNYLFENETVAADVKREAGCVVDFGRSRAFVHHGDFASKRVTLDSGYRFLCNDGDVTTSGPLTTLTVPFGCGASKNNAGCSTPVTCPGGRKVVGIRLGCNLESAALGASVDSLVWDVVEVLRPSDYVKQGECSLALPKSEWKRLGLPALTIHSGKASAAPYLGGLRGFTARCQEYDKNGGDCRVQGEALCL